MYPSVAASRRPRNLRPRLGSGGRRYWLGLYLAFLRGGWANLGTSSHLGSGAFPD